VATSYTELADSVVVSSSTVPVYSQPVSMSGANAVVANIVISVLSAGTLTVAVQGSNDLENWAPITTSGGATLGIGFHTPSAGSIAWQYVRLSYLCSTSATAVLSAGLSTADL